MNPALAPAPEAKKQEETAAEKYQGEKKGEQEDKGRCFQCRKKVGLLGVQCKCTYVYCNLHRMPENHACTYNYEAEGKDNLKKQIKKIQHEKYQKLDA